jgi:glycerol kinase
VAEPWIGALDQGTTSTRFMVFDRSGKVIALAQKEHEQIYPQPGWVEHRPREIWERTIEVIDEACAKGCIAPKQVAALGITNQRETTVVWDRRTGEPVMNALVWQDTRVGELVAGYAQEGGQDRFRARTGLPLATYFSGLKLRWILDHVPGARAGAEAGHLLFGNMDAYLLWNLTGGVSGGVHRTDVTNASRTQLMNLDTLDWDAEMLRLFEIPRAMMPEICSSSSLFGEMTTTRLAGVPIGGMLGDQHAALVGQTCFKPGQLKNTYGTGCFLLMNTGEKKVLSKNGLLTTLGYKFGDAPAVYALEGSIAITGALVQWLRDNLGMIQSSSEVETLARSVADNGGVYIVPAFSGLYAPYWKDTARGVIVGLTRYANRGHIARAVLEATAFQTREVVEAMEADSGIVLDRLRTDGGMVANDLLMQFQADLLDRRVERPEMRETTALGAAYAAGLACGVYKDTSDMVANWSVNQVWEPQMDAGVRARLYRQWKKAVTRSLTGWKTKKEARPMKKALVGELIAEAVAVCMIIAIGDSVACMFSLYDPNPYGGSYWGVCITWGLAVTLAIYTTASVSGCHANPAVTLALAIFRKFSWAKVLPYSVAQVIGGIAGAAIVYALFNPVIDLFNQTHHLTRAAGGAAGVFFTHTGTGITPMHAFSDEIILTAILNFGIFAITEQYNEQAPGANSGALMIGFLVAAIGASMGYLEAWAINPARDLGPRLFAFAAGWGPSALPSPDNFWWIPIVAPLLGGVVGGGLYQGLIHQFLPARNRARAQA